MPNCRCSSSQPRAALPLTTDAAIVEPDVLFAQLQAKHIEHLDQTVGHFDEQIAGLVAPHADRALFRVLPVADGTLVSRLIVAFGSDRDRDRSAEEIQCPSGIVPVTRQSRKSRRVSRRYAYPKFLKQTFHEFADQARKWTVGQSLLRNDTRHRLPPPRRRPCSGLQMDPHHLPVVENPYPLQRKHPHQTTQKTKQPTHHLP